MEKRHSAPITRFDPEALLQVSGRLARAFIEVLQGFRPDLASRVPVPGAAPAGPVSTGPPGAAAQEDWIQACSVYFHLLNVAEEFCSTRERVKREAASLVEAGTDAPYWNFRSVVQRLAAEGASAGRIRAFLRGFEIQPVITAHPTEAKRVTILEIHKRLYSLLEEYSSKDLTLLESRELEERLQAAIEVLLQTGEIFIEKPRVEDEVENGLFYFKQTFYPVTPVVLGHLRRTLEAFYPGESFEIPAVLQFSSWRGGDRDGNPFVTAAVTRRTVLRHAETAAELHRAEMDALIKDLSQSLRETGVSAALSSSLEKDAAEVPGFEALHKRNANEPYRLKLTVMKARLDARQECLAKALPRREWPAHAYKEADDLLRDVEIMHRSLSENGGSRAAQAYLVPFEIRVRTFGLHLAKLDIRENSEALSAAVAEIARLRYGFSYDGLAEEARCRWLEARLAETSPPALPAAYSPATREVLDTFEAVRWAQGEVDAQVIGSYVISMTRDVSDILAAYFLFKEAGLWTGAGCPVSVTPLFETIEDLERAPGILERLFGTDPVRRSLGIRSMLQQVMVGYSDSNKDGGFIASNWMLYRAQSRMTEVADRCGVMLKFFHGVGGSVSRGGRPVQRAILSLPENTLRGRIKLTEQGETISSKYSNRETAIFNLKVLVGSVMASTLTNELRPAPVPDEYAAEMQALAADSFAAYRALVEAEGFVSYFRHASPLDAIGALNIGSRPAKRKETKGIADLRAIPWVFSWTQNRHLISGWFGAGAAFDAAARDPRRLALLRRMYAEWSFFGNLLMSLRESLLTADMEIARVYSELCPDPAVRERIYGRIASEYESAVRGALAITGTAALDAEHPNLSFTGALRRPLLKEMNLAQAALLKKFHAGTASEEDRTHLLLTVNCIASGLRTTG